MKPYLFTAETGNQEKQKKTIDDPSEDEEKNSEDEAEVIYEIKNKPVDRKNKLTKTERNLKLLKKLKKQE